MADQKPICPYCGYDWATGQPDLYPVSAWYITCGNCCSRGPLSDSYELAESWWIPNAENKARYHHSGIFYAEKKSWM